MHVSNAISRDSEVKLFTRQRGYMEIKLMKYLLFLLVLPSCTPTKHIELNHQLIQKNTVVMLIDDELELALYDDSTFVMYCHNPIKFGFGSWEMDSVNAVIRIKSVSDTLPIHKKHSTQFSSTFRRYNGSLSTVCDLNGCYPCNWKGHLRYFPDSVSFCRSDTVSKELRDVRDMLISTEGYRIPR